MSFRDETFSATCDLTLLPRIRLFAGHRTVRTLPRRSGPGQSPYPQAASSLVVRPLTCNDGRITRIWSLPEERPPARLVVLLAGYVQVRVPLAAHHAVVARVRVGVLVTIEP